MNRPTDGGADGVRVPDRRMIDPRVAAPVGRAPWSAPPSTAAPARAGSVAPDADRSADAGVRPFVITDGRTTPVDEQLRIETPVVAIGRAVALDFERRQIVDLCRTPLSVAEVGAALGLPLAVARVLVADLVAVGAVAVPEQDAPVSRALLERILEGVHAL